MKECNKKLNIIQARQKISALSALVHISSYLRFVRLVTLSLEIISWVWRSSTSSFTQMTMNQIWYSC